MSSHEPEKILVPLIELQEMRAQLNRIEQRLNADLAATRKSEPKDATLTVKQFAAEIGRSAKNCDFVYDLISDGVIIPLRGKRPYLIPRSELDRYKTVRKPRG